MKFTLFIVASIITLTSATRLCDNLLRIRSDLSSISTNISGNNMTRAALNSAYMSLTDASSTLDSLTVQITQATNSIDTASLSLATLDIQTGANLGWLKDLLSGLQQVSVQLRSIYQKGGRDLQDGNTQKVKGYGQLLVKQAQDALSKLTAAQFTLNEYNRDVLCWTS